MYQSAHTSASATIPRMTIQLPKHLQEKLDAYEELVASPTYSPADAHASDVRQIKLGQFSEMTREMVAPMAPGALTVIWEIANGGYNATPSIMAKCAMFIVDRTIGKDASDIVDPMAKLIAELSGTPTPVGADHDG